VSAMRASAAATAEPDVERWSVGGRRNCKLSDVHRTARESNDVRE
jgi:hypothetical protein